MMEHVLGCADVWVASMGEIARHIRGLSLAPRSIEFPADLS